jgi:PAS domain S-box-containing protein
MTEDEKKDFRRSVIDRQLRKLCLSRDSLPNNLSLWQSYIQKIEFTYKQYEEERYTVARSLELTSQEMKELYEKLKEFSQQQLKMERDKLQAIISSLGDGLALLNDDGCVLFINPQGCELLGQSRINISGSNFFDFFDISAEKVLNVNNTIKEKGSISFETALVTKSSRLPVHLTVTSFSAQFPATKALVVVFRDISFQLAARKTMEVERDLATRASALKSDFLASMSHEIRTPINGIISLVELLEYSELNEEQKQDVATIKDCADSLKSLITNVLDLSKIEAGKIFLDPVDTGLKPFVDRIIGKFRGSSSKKNIKIRFATSGDIPTSIKVDSYRLDQVISNLLSNAIKFSPEHSLVSVTVQLASSETGKKALLFSVQDQGDGIPASKLETIFDAYTQAGQSQVDKQSGTGLGLSICLKLVELMGGRIWAESILGKGSKFCFTISYLDVESTESAADFSRNDELDIFNNNSGGNIL